LNLHTFQLTSFATNCYVVEDEGEALVIDPGEAADTLLATIEYLTVRAIVNTHCHCDHCGGNAALKTRTGAPLLCHEKELPLLRAIEQQGMMFGVSFPASPDPDGYLQEGDTVSVGGVGLSVREAPGHSPGHIILVGDGLVFAGDVLFAGSIGRTDLPGANQDQLIASIREQVLCLPDATRVYSGHGPSTTIGEERRHNPFLQGL